MKTSKAIAGSYVVVWKNAQHYIDARKDVRYPNMSFIEVVRDGFVRQRLQVPNDRAPETIVELMK